MAECPYCSASLTDEDRYCPRCGERQTDLESRDGFLDPETVLYLDGVRNGARPLDPDAPAHQQLEADLGAAIADFGHLAGVDLDLRDSLDIADVTALDSAIDPATETDAGVQQLLGLAVLLGLAADAFPETGVDELLAYQLQLREQL